MKRIVSVWLPYWQTDLEHQRRLTNKCTRRKPLALTNEIRDTKHITAACRHAQKLGIDPESPNRVRAGLKYVLSHKADEGHVFQFRPELIAACQEMLDLSETAISDGISALVAAEDVVSEIVEEQEAIYLVPFYYAEIGVVNSIGKLLQHPQADLSQSAFEQTVSQIERTLAI